MANRVAQISTAIGHQAHAGSDIAGTAENASSLRIQFLSRALTSAREVEQLSMGDAVNDGLAAPAGLRP